jgi:hypothetical protein
MVGSAIGCSSPFTSCQDLKRMTPVADVAAPTMLRTRLRLALRMTGATANHAVAAKDDALYAALTASEQPGKAYALPKTGSYTTPVENALKSEDADAVI